MSMLAKAPRGSIRRNLNSIVSLPEFSWIRSPEVGTAMVRGKVSGTGSAFNLGEMTVTRCVLKLASGELGYAYIQGRSSDCAEAAAMVDALMQTEYASTVKSLVLNPLQTEMQQHKAERAAKAAATKVDFFTMARGED